jgi:hypothetical protein
MDDDERWGEARDRDWQGLPGGGRAPQGGPGPSRGLSRPDLRSTGMVSHGATGDPGTSGRYYEDYDQRAQFGGYAGGVPDYSAARPRSYDRGAERGRYPERSAGDRSFGDEARRELPYRDYGREHDSFGAGGGYTPEPREGFGREARTWDAATENHRGRGPKGYRLSDERLREDVSDRLTEDAIVDATDVEVLVADGEVTLNGAVTSRTAKRRAEDCAEDVTGVKHVQNNLRVDTTPRPGTLGAVTDPRIAAVAEGKDEGDASKDLAH